ncbi:hypothetical protein NA56DRAFT_700792 [Hyaloscypha hepaticicola]|uniref:Uncharacterized protein n=1 Tax=Hyaloscypha hepaticicola TaxID=2082293 RepID=A0A2J6QDG7_9HELO|nr:hypothetical protein NA56DRAFT_700792 [Hyaloscypha hepaticicola]
MLAHLKHQKELCFQRNQQLIKQQFSGRPQPSSSAAQTPQKIHLAQKIKPPSRGSCCSLSTLPVLLEYLKLGHQPERGEANASMEVRNHFSTSSRAHVSLSTSIYQSSSFRAVTVGIQGPSAFHRSDLVPPSQWEHSIPSQKWQIEPLKQTTFPEKCMDDDPLLCIGEIEICDTSTRRIGPEGAEPAIAVRR